MMDDKFIDELIKNYKAGNIETQDEELKELL